MKAADSVSSDPVQNAPGYAIRGTAAEWIARRNGGFDARAERELRDWLAADPRHAEAFAECNAVWARLNAPRQTGDAVWIAQQLRLRQQRRTRRRQRYLAGAIGLAAAAVLVFAVLPFSPGPSAPAVPLTIALRPDRHVLADGSVVELNVGAEIAVDFSPQRRGVRLLRGEALFTVAKDAARPFVVIAGAVEARAVGTAFAVRRQPDQVGVLVTEGRVAVERIDAGSSETSPDAPALAKAPPVYLGKSHEVIVPADPRSARDFAVKALSETDVATALAWRGKRIELTETSLAEAVALFNRQNRVQLSIADPALRERRITGILWADDPNGFVRLLTSALDAETDRSGDLIVIRRR